MEVVSTYTADKQVKCGHCKRNTVIVCTVKTKDSQGKTVFADICNDCREKLLETQIENRRDKEINDGR